MKQKKSLLILVAILVWTGTQVGAEEKAISFGQLTAINSGPDDAGPAAKVDLMTVEELKSMIAKNQAVTIIDVRASESFAESDNQIKGSIHFRLRRLRSRLKFPPLRDLPRDRELVTYCACPDDKASIRAAEILMEGGFKRVRALKGGWVAWVSAGGPVQPRSK
jgi:rhodanese-related sulfurtransferase